MGGAASSRSQQQPSRPVSDADRHRLEVILRACAEETAVYTKCIQDAVNFMSGVNFNPPASPCSRSASGLELDGFANSKGQVVDDPGPASNSASDAETQERAAQFATLIEWLTGNGAQIHAVDVKESGTSGFAVHCNQDVPATATVMKIPYECMITDSVAAATPTGKALANLRDRLAALAHCQLSVHLLEDMERGAQSPFHSYYNSLPRSLPQHSLFWTDEEKQWLEGTCFLEDVISFELMVQRDYDTIVAAVPAFARFPRKKFLWSRVIVSSRNFSIRVKGEDHIALVPLADMMNHNEPRKTAWEYRDEDTAFVVTSLYDFGAGGQITNSYGQKSASQLLLHYGFIPSNFGRNRVELIENQITVELAPTLAAGPSHAEAEVEDLLEKYSAADGDASSTAPVREDDFAAKGNNGQGFIDTSTKKAQHVWLKAKLLGEPRVCRVRVNVAHQDTANALRYLSIIAADNKQHLHRIKRIEKASFADHSASTCLPYFFSVEHLSAFCDLLIHLSEQHMSRLEAQFKHRNVDSIAGDNNVNAWRIAKVEWGVATFFKSAGLLTKAAAEIHEDLHARVIHELRRRHDWMSQWVFHLVSCCVPMLEKVAGRHRSRTGGLELYYHPATPV